jgi:hypothetical protein
MPFLAAGVVAIIGGAIRAGRWPDYTVRAIVGTAALTVAASATGGSAVAPLVRAVGMLLLLTTVMAATLAATERQKAKKTS